MKRIEIKRYGLIEKARDKGKDSQQDRDRVIGSTTERRMPRYKEAKAARGRHRVIVRRERDSEIRAER